MNRSPHERPFLGTLIAALVASTTLAPGCGGGGGGGGGAGGAPTATEAVCNNRAKAIPERNAAKIKKPQAARSK